ncbi:hypothetical protein J7E63_05485 [Bacillus sp. ISL-75]|nr:hypothetical protein [Bacillus sp. ISL-75]
MEALRTRNYSFHSKVVLTVQLEDGGRRARDRIRTRKREAIDLALQRFQCLSRPELCVVGNGRENKRIM